MLTCAALTIGLHIGTYHFDRTRSFNEVNLGAYVVCDGYTAGAYHNSERSLSLYAGKTFKRVVGPIDVTLGGVTGYSRAPIVPMLVPSTVVFKHTRLSLLLPLEKGGGGVHLSTEF